MPSQSNYQKENSRRGFAKKLAAVLAAMPISLLATQASAQKQARKKLPGAPPEQIEQVSPITIGGGSSVSIFFSHVHYKGANGKYSNQDDEIHTAQVFDRRPRLRWELMPFVKSIDCKITVHTTKKDGSEPEDIIVDSMRGGPFSIAFNEGVFKLDATDPDSHYEEDRKIVGKIEVFNKTTKLTAEFEPPEKGACYIHLYNTKD